MRPLEPEQPGQEPWQPVHGNGEFAAHIRAAGGAKGKERGEAEAERGGQGEEGERMRAARAAEEFEEQPREEPQSASKAVRK